MAKLKNAKQHVVVTIIALLYIALATKDYINMKQSHIDRALKQKDLESYIRTLVFVALLYAISVHINNSGHPYAGMVLMAAPAIGVIAFGVAWVANEKK